jgi:hypothetical protein
MQIEAQQKRKHMQRHKDRVIFITLPVMGLEYLSLARRTIACAVLWTNASIAGTISRPKRISFPGSDRLCSRLNSLIPVLKALLFANLLHVPWLVLKRRAFPCPPSMASENHRR